MSENENSGGGNAADYSYGGGNSADCSSVRGNSADCSSVRGNPGRWSSGEGNSGDYNYGDRNAGNYNSGHKNSGTHNSGHKNSGDGNPGDYNSGDHNPGHRNSGDHNPGWYNTGNYNSGDRNPGCWNSGDRNPGYLNTNDAPLRIFNKETPLKSGEILFPSFFHLTLSRRIIEDDMTNEEKEVYPDYKTTGGYLKEIDYKEAWKNSWDNTTKEDKRKVMNLPNWDNDIFLEITGIDVEKELKCVGNPDIQREYITIGGIKYKRCDDE